MYKEQESIYSQNYKGWYPVTRHRAGSRTAPNILHFDGYFSGHGGVPFPAVRLVRNGVEIERQIGNFTANQAYQENDEIHVRIQNKDNLRGFYVRYNQIKELLVNLNEFPQLRNIGFRKNYVANLGVQDLSNLDFLTDVDYSDNWSMTDIIFSDQAPIMYYNLQGTSIPQSKVDIILQQIVNGGLTNGTFTYPGRPSYDASDNYNTAASRGWNLGLAPFAGTIETLAITSAGLSSADPIIASHRIHFMNRNADGTLREEGSFSGSHPGNFTDFVENGYIETEYYHPTIVNITLMGKQIKVLYLNIMPNLNIANFESNNITDMDISSNTNITSLRLRYNPINNITGVALNPLNYLDLRDNNLLVGDIDTILSQLRNNIIDNGTFLYSVKPSSMAIADYDALIARGWTLSIEPDDFILTVGNITTNSVDVSWTASVTPGTPGYYSIDFKKNNETWLVSSFESTSVLSKTIQVDPGAEYDIQIRLLDEDYNTIKESNIVPITTLAALTINILTPTEGQEITGDVNITFELLGSTGINIITPTEGQEITGDVNITFEIL